MAYSAHDVSSEISDYLVKFVHRSIPFFLDVEKRFMFIGNRHVNEQIYSTYTGLINKEIKKNRRKWKLRYIRYVNKIKGSYCVALVPWNLRSLPVLLHFFVVIQFFFFIFFRSIFNNRIYLTDFNSEILFTWNWITALIKTFYNF